MVAQENKSPRRRYGSSSGAGLRLVVFHASPDVGTHIEPLTRIRRFQVTHYSQCLPRPRRPTTGVNAVLWELAPGRRPNWRWLREFARETPVASYSLRSGSEVLDRSKQLGFACHLVAPLNGTEVANQIGLASHEDLSTRLRQLQPTLRRFLNRVDVVREMNRSVNDSLEPVQVADALVARAAAWLPAASWAVVGMVAPDPPSLLAERGLWAGVKLATCAVGAWVIDHSREYCSASLRDDKIVEDAADVATIALPLVCRGRTVAALVGVDRESSVEVPRLSTSMLDVFRAFLEPGAFALDNAYHIQRVEALSVTDDLTQLYNSRYLEQTLRREVKRQVRSHHPLSLLFIDMDDFKGVNDQYGHLYGSRALVEAAGIIRGCARETDVVARFGGDEFAIVLPDTSSNGALAVAKRVCERICEYVFLQHEGVRYRLTASTGVATLPDAASTSEELIQAADTAMCQVKAEGKNGIRLTGATFREDMSA